MKVHVSGLYIGLWGLHNHSIYRGFYKVFQGFRDV